MAESTPKYDTQDALESDEPITVEFDQGVEPAHASGYVQVPRLILRDDRLGSYAKLAYGVLQGYAWHEGGSCYPGLPTICNELSVSRPTATKALRELQTAGYIRVVRRGQGQPNLYTLLTTRTVEIQKERNFPSREKAPFQLEGSHVSHNRYIDRCNSPAPEGLDLFEHPAPAEAGLDGPQAASLPLEVTVSSENPQALPEDHLYYALKWGRGDKPKRLNKAQMQHITETLQLVGSATFRAAVDWAAVKNIPDLSSIRTAAVRMGKEGRKVATRAVTVSKLNGKPKHDDLMDFVYASNPGLAEAEKAMMARRNGGA